MRQDIEERLAILNAQAKEAKQMRTRAKRAHQRDEVERLNVFINFTNYAILDCYREDADDWLNSLPEQNHA